ncbi:translation initiation factor IF-3 [Prosthecobacter debontii]|uniref:Translation initiation factor IF-3 n=1 Tax=Prosthecobacter debontii TaxID=48467 RepID=A0A1T4YZX1_9BACT|nr:translation initiation factor IF-3 [Prosthecobacter debontii]SKB07193.1 translation initiation factor IF-3 [Prosthecobacter debontii]
MNSGGPSRPGGNRGPDRRNNGRYADQTRVNERIRAPKVRVVDGITNQQYGVLLTAQALRMARERGLDLVEVASNAEPPVCKIVDYGKYKYIQEKHKKEAHKHQKGGKLKELKFRIGIDPHDYHIKIVHAEDFLAEGHKVRIQLQFRGRQMAHQELGHELAAKIKADLLTMGHADQEPKMAGRNINMQISPLPERQRVRKFKTHLKGVTEHKDMHHGDHDPREDKHDEHDDHDDHHDDHAEQPPVNEASPTQA